MSSVNGNVTPGYTFAFDANQRFQITRDRLNLLGTPTVTMTLTGKVNSSGADVVNSSITAAMLADAVADMLITAVATVGNDAGTTIQVDIQAKDGQGNNLAANVVMDVWLHDAVGTLTPSATATTSSAISGTKGYVLLAIANGVCGKYVTDSTGLLTIVFTQAGALTRYLSVGVQGKHVAGSQALVFVA